MILVTLYQQLTRIDEIFILFHYMIPFLDEINRSSLKPIAFSVNVIREDLISQQCQLVRQSPIREWNIGPIFECSSS